MSAQNRRPSRCSRCVEAPKLDLDDFLPGVGKLKFQFEFQCESARVTGGGRGGAVQVRVRENGEVRGGWSSSANSSSRRSKLDFFLGGLEFEFEFG